ncbi:hypothetical protein RCH09_000154 [Actimicrobium sp. GrIS 1.19]|nr:hypothetical protein [Actimicrobium sp. GrIS 1.19]
MELQVTLALELMAAMKCQLGGQVDPQAARAILLGAQPLLL